MHGREISVTKSVTHKDYVNANPVDLIEETILSEDYSYHRLSRDEIVLEVSGRWEDYRFQFVWQEEMKILQLFCVLGMRVHPKDLVSVNELIALVNEQLPLGHFEISPDEAAPAYRYSLLLPTMNVLTADYLEELVDIALFESDRFYPAFQFVISEHKSAREAASLALFETLGEA